MPRTAYAAIATAALLLGACGGDSSESAAIATLDSDATSAADTGAVSGDPADAEAAGLEFAQCMRDNGFPDFEDPTVDAEGNVQIFQRGGADAGGGADFRSEDGQAAQDTCGTFLEGVALGGGRGAGGGEEVQAQLTEALLPYTECLRGEGLDVGDLDLAQGFGGQGGQAGAPADGGGRGRAGAGGDPSERIAGQLGLDVEDPATAAAVETCQPIFDEAFTAIPGRGN